MAGPEKFGHPQGGDWAGYGRTPPRATPENVERVRAAEVALKRHSGLYETVKSWCGVSDDPPTPLTFDQVVDIVSADDAALEAAKGFLAAKWNYTGEYAEKVRERLAWAIVEKLKHNPRHVG